MLTKDVPPPPGGKKRIAVIGGGVSGVMTTLELSKLGHEVSLFEQGALGNGSSGRSAACIRAQFTTPSTVRGMNYAECYFARWQEMTGEATNLLTQNGYLFLYDIRTPRKEILKRVQMQQDAGLTQVRFLEQEEVSKMFPFVGFPGLVGATWCPTDGFLRHDIVYNDGAAAAERIGAKIHQNTRVVGVVRDNRRIKKLIVEKKGDQRQEAVDLVINATGPWADSVSRLLGASELPVEAKKRYLVFLEIASDQKHGDKVKRDLCGHEGCPPFEKWPFIISPNGAYCRPEGRNLMMGWIHATDPVESPIDEKQDTIEPGCEPANRAGYAHALRREILSLMGGIEEESFIGPKKMTAGFYEETPDHNPIIDYDSKTDNLIHAVGFSGHGLMHSPFTAFLVAQLVQAERQLTLAQLPWNLGEVSLVPYQIDRNFSTSENMQI